MFKKILFGLAIIVSIPVLTALCIYLYTMYQINGHARFWKEMAETPTKENELVYVALGDSDAQGIGVSNPLKGYVGQFAQKLASNKHQSVHIINLSKSGAQTKDVLRNQLPQLNNLKPDIVTVSIGGNDVLHKASEKEVSANLQKIASQLPAGTLMADLPTFERGNERLLGINSRKYVQQLANQYNLKYVPINRTTETHFWELNQYAIDFFHPSEKQYTLWAEAF